MESTNTVIIPVVKKSDWNRFVKYPYRFYKKDPNWVPPLLTDQKILLDSEKNPFFQHARIEYFIAERNKKIVGRIAAIVDENHNRIHKENTGFFGFFEAINEFEVAEKLLSAAKEWVTKQGMDAFRGPVNPSQNETCGLLIDDFSAPPLIMMTYNPPYYVELFEQFGLKKIRDLYAYYGEGKEPPEKVVHIAEVLRKKAKITVRPIDMKIFDREAEKVWQIYNQAWIKNWGFVPMTEEEFQHLAKNLKHAIVPDIALLAEIDGKPVGFSLALPDLNQALIKTNGRLFPFGLLKILWYSRKIDQLRIVILGVLHEYRKHGIDALLYFDTWRNGAKKGFYKGEMSWILEDNKMMRRAAERLGGKIYRTYRMYQMKT